jgi:predicted CopG family antitoxin
MKQILDADRLQYKKQLAEFMQEINPKPTLEDIEKLKQQYLDRRKETSVNITEEAKY